MIVCQVWRSPKKTEMYLYTEQEEGTGRVPQTLLDRFGEPEPAITLKLTEQRKLARANAAQVMQSIREQGYYLQMPPSQDEQMSEISKLNEKLPRA